MEAQRIIDSRSGTLAQEVALARASDQGGVIDLPADSVQMRVVELLLHSDLGYQAIADHFGRSRGWVYQIALAHGARKHEARIMERASDRKRRQREFLQEVMNATQKSDVLDFLHGMPSESVALHATSFPYNIGVDYGSGHGDRAGYHYFIAWCGMVLAEMTRTLKPGGVLFLNVGSTYGPCEGHAPWPMDVPFFNMLAAMGLVFQSRVVWVIPHGLTPKRRLAERYETCLVFSRGEVAHFNPTGARTPTKQPGKRYFKGPRKGEISSHPLGSHPSNVWVIPNVGHNHPEKSGHPAQFPEELVRRAVHLWTMPGDLVADVFSGSGTVQAQCVRTGRRFVGCDLFYADLRAARLAAVAPDTYTALPGVTDESLAVWQAEAVPVRSEAVVTPVVDSIQLDRLVSDDTDRCFHGQSLSLF